MCKKRLNSVSARVFQLWRENELDQADSLLDQKLAEEPDEGRLWELVGLTWLKMGRNGEALRALEMASALVPLGTLARCALAECYLQAGQNDVAREMLVYLATEARCCTALLPKLASHLGRIGEIRLALRVCRDASQREPDRDEPLYAMAYYMRKLQYPATTIASVLRRALQLAPESTVYRVALANLYRELRHWDDAYQVARCLAPRQVGCPKCASHMLSVFRVVGDDRLCQSWQARLAELIDCDG